MIARILELNLKYPQFNDPRFTNRYPDVDEDIKGEYDVYAMMVWNCIGLISLEYQGRTDRCPFQGAVQYWSTLHRKWLDEENRGQFYGGIYVDLPGLRIPHASLRRDRFPDVSRRERIKRVNRRIGNFAYYQCFCLLLSPISAKHRKAFAEYVSRAA
jgi:hypothetical protein